MKRIKSDAETQNTMDGMLYAEYIAHAIQNGIEEKCATLQLNVPEIFLVEKIY